ncbi:aldehyde oxidase GLOX1-like [Punica granatum]|uniref:Uncharacterized protein n=2 Tax=Punica granatum TaxID=22663 RepID=A0A218WZ40_PUNGR|nr:aldehyde oxidase GLOX1-like [Punica granatum]OWM77913.1 hypothetical protein CDL15_Pgr018482 [Punica granatum]PKI74323.1 hypothetical protein CRG98_005299 [Punica granatum]
MAAPFPRALLFLILVLAPGYSHAGFFSVEIEGFNPEKLISDAKKFFDANDGGLKGEAGKYADDVDSLSGEEAGFVDVDPANLPKDKDEFDTKYAGKWELVSQNSGVSAMHMQLMPNNKALIFDSTVFGPSLINFPKGDVCPLDPTKKPDCTAHAVIYDTENAALRPLHIVTNPWCSSGNLAADGSVLSTGGFEDGAKSIRTLGPCDTCDWQDTPNVLGDPRWYATQVTLEDGSFIVVGGRKAYSYELVPPTGKPNGQAIYFPFIDETTDLDENNLYPFVHLLPDGNLFVFANSRSILFDPKGNKVIKEFPRLLGGSRNYPASGMSALLPLRLDDKTNSKDVQAQVIICGGARPKAFRLAEKNKTYVPALQDCGRLVVSDPNPAWMRENMPSRRVMGDMLILPTGDLLMLNGAKKGASAWGNAKEPNYKPVLFRPNKVGKDRFKELKAATIPRMYHSTSIVLPDGKILVGGSNTNSRYFFKGVEFPTEMRMEKFSPPYLAPALQKYRPQILVDVSDNTMTYGNDFHIRFLVGYIRKEVRMQDIKVTMYAPPFTTHGYSMNQRLIQLGIPELSVEGGVHHALTRAPPSGRIAPPGYYLVFVVYRGVPSIGTWVRIQ